MAQHARNEFELIDRIIARLGDAVAGDILVPPGDDAAVWLAGGATVATTDALVEGTHWRADTMSLADVGWRAIAANASDIAAMGAIPQYALVALTLDGSENDASGGLVGPDGLDGFIDGLAASCRQHGVRIAGGDIVRGSERAFAVTMLGRAEVEAGVGGGSGSARVLLRSAARPGDAIAVSGHPGASAAGLALIEDGREDEAAAAPLLAAHRRPIGRVDLGRAAVAAGVACAIDISDGLLQDAGHIAERSGVGVEIDIVSLPLHPAAMETLGPQRAMDLALGGGEDFELALAGPADVLASLSTAELPVTVIGSSVEAHAGKSWALTIGGDRYEPPVAGWDQLRRQSAP